MQQQNLQIWLKDFCVARKSVAAGVIMVSPDANTRPSLAATWPAGVKPAVNLLAAAAKLVNQQRHAIETGLEAPVGDQTEKGLIALPLRSEGESLGAIAFQLHVGKSSLADDAATFSLEQNTAEIGLFDLTEFGSASGPEALLTLHAAVISCETFPEAANAAASGLAEALKFSRVAIGVMENGYCRAVALSHGMPAESGNPLIQAISRSMDEAVEQQASVTLPPVPGSRPRITLAHAELARRNPGSLCTIPLVRAAEIFGAVTLQRPTEAALGPEELARCEQFVGLIAPALSLLYTREVPWHRRLRQGSRDLLNQRGKVAALVAAPVLLALLWLPVTHWVGAPAHLEGAVQRAVVAPADGFLKSALVRPGDKVRAGQVLVEMLEQDLQLEQQKLQSEMASHENAARGALAKGDRTLYATSSAKADASAAQLALIEQQRQRARVTAPFDGIVIKGDLSQSLGAPVQRGEVLLVVAPEGEYRLIIDVDERDIPHVTLGQEGVLALSAFNSGGQLEFRVSRITPLATARDGRNFFEVEGQLNTLPPTARPGLQGIAKIRTGQRAFGWVWGHRLVDWLRLKLWAWGG